MRLLLILWFIPMVLFWGWYGLSSNDMSFGFAMLSRHTHDLVIGLYANTLGIDPQLIPGMIASACALDTAIIMGIAAFRWRKSWWPQFRETVGQYWNQDLQDDFSREYSQSGRVHPAE